MLVLIACEYSGRVRDAFRARGHNAWSVDILPTEGDPRYHIQGDALDEIDALDWDLVVAFPPCTYLTNSNAWRWDAIEAERKEALEFVRAIMDAKHVDRIAVENPAGAIGTQIRKADQYVQPWHFGDPFQKMTGLWLKNLPKLIPAVTTKPEDVVPWAQAGYGPRDANGRRTSKGPAGGAVRKAHERSRTFQGIAQAMADQWGRDL